MAASFEFAGQTLERYYHFHCLSDRAFFDLLEELGLAMPSPKQTSWAGWTPHPGGAAPCSLPPPAAVSLALSAARRALPEFAPLATPRWHPRHRLAQNLAGRAGLRPALAEAFCLQVLRLQRQFSAAGSGAASVAQRITPLAKNARLFGGRLAVDRCPEQRLQGLGYEIQLSSPVQAIRSNGPGRARYFAPLPARATSMP